jgi:hypothetical protein
MRLSMGLLCTLLVIQFFFLRESSRIYLSSIDRLEGEPVILNLPLYAVNPLHVSDKSESPATGPFKALRESRSIVIKTIRPVSSDQIFVIVNGEMIGDFAKGDRKFTVFNGDYIEIDASNYQGQAQFVFNVPDSGLTFPIDGLVIDADRTIVPVGRVKFK